MKKKITMWKVSVALFAVVFAYGLWFMYKKTLTTMILLLLFTAGACAFYIVANKRIMMPGGYTMLQARRFYMNCSEQGLTTRRRLSENMEQVREIAKRFDFAESMDDEALIKLYSDGRSVENAMKK